MVHANERMLTGGFYAEVELSYDPTIAQEKNGRPFGIETMREIQLSKREVLPTLYEGRQAFSTEEWKDFLIRSIGMEPEKLTPRGRDMVLLRMVPFVERNYNVVELGPRGTGKSHLFQQISPYAHLVSGGKSSVARMFVNNSSGQRGLVCQYDVVCFDEISGVSFDQKDGVNIMKGYMESGEFSRGKESIRADGGMVMVGNFDVDVQHQQRIGHLFGPLPAEMRDDTAFMDRIHAYLPGWDVPKVSREVLTDHFGLVSDYLSECWNQLRRQSRQSVLQGRVHLGGALSGRDTTGVMKTVSGLIKLVSPPAFKESVRCAEQNLYTRAKELVGDRDPRQHEFSIQLRAFDSAKSGSGVGVGVLLALCSSLLQKSVKGGLMVTGGLNLGGSIETIHNPVSAVEIAVEKGAQSILMPISSRRQLNDLPDDIAAKITILYYLDARDALLKALVD